MSLLEINNLHTYFDTRKGLIKAVNGVSFSVDEGKTLGIVGESGSGKSQTAMSILQLFHGNQRIYEGSVTYDGKVLSEMKPKDLRDIRGNDISMIFQEPMTSLNPVFTIEKQINEVLILHQGLSKKEASAKSLEMLQSVKIPQPERVLTSYPFQLSGGMSQRVMIAMALACNPRVLIADEPTTALDVIIQAEILKLMNDLKKEFNTAILFITHDLGVISEMADDVIVMYGGKIVEAAPIKSLFDNPVHPYTKRLIAAFLRTDISSSKGAKNTESDFYDGETDEYSFDAFREGKVDPDWVQVDENHHVAVTLK